jgi:hypothetical protein
VHYLLHLPDEGHLLDHLGIIRKSDVIELMVNYLGSSSSPTDADYEVTSTKGAHVQFTYLRCILTSNQGVVRQTEKDKDVANMHMYQDG